MTTHLEISVKDFGYPETSPLHYGPLQLPNSPFVDDFEEEQDEYTPSGVVAAAAAAAANSNRYSIIPAPTISYESENSEYEQGDDDEEYNTETELEESELNTKAVALFAFTPENENEIELTQGQMIWINYRYGQGWLVASDLTTGEMGLIPEEYVRLLKDEEEDCEHQETEREDDEWESEEEEDYQKELIHSVKDLKV